VGKAGVAGDAEPPPPRAGKGKKAGFNSLEVLARKKAAEREEAAAAAANAAVAAAARREAADAAAAARRAQGVAMRKRNARGQPLMRYRIDGILSKLQAESAFGAR